MKAAAPDYCPDITGCHDHPYGSVGGWKKYFLARTASVLGALGVVWWMGQESLLQASREDELNGPGVDIRYLPRVQAKQSRPCGQGNATYCPARELALSPFLQALGRRVERAFANELEYNGGALQLTLDFPHRHWTRQELPGQVNFPTSRFKSEIIPASITPDLRRRCKRGPTRRARLGTAVLGLGDRLGRPLM